MSTTLNVCSKCRTTCPLCHSDASSKGHAIWVCRDCDKKYAGKCCVCGGKKNSSGAGKVCFSCRKPNNCTFCGKHF